MRVFRARAGLALAVLALMAVACGGGGGDTGGAATDVTGAPTGATTGATGTGGTGAAAGDLGAVTVGAGAPIEIANIQTISGGTAALGQDQVTASEIAIEDFGGELLGHPIQMSVEDGLCSAEGGTTAAQSVVANPQIVGALGTSCSGAGVPAAQIITDAGGVLISGSTTSPSLTALPYLSDEPLEAQENYNEGFFRTAHNDEFQGAGAAQFAFDELGAMTAVTIHDGDPYTEGLTGQFGIFFEELGGTVALPTAVNKGDTDMRPILTEVVAAAPDIVFMPIFQPEADFIVQQATEFPDLEDVTFMGADGLLSGTFTEIPETQGMYFSGPSVQQEGEGYQQLVAAYEEATGGPPIQAFHAHAYDATMILLTAIEAVAQQDGDSLTIDRRALRDYVYDLEGYEGLTGTLSCNEFGDCAQPSIGVYLNEDPAAGISAVVSNVVYTSAPEVDPEKLS